MMHAGELTNLLRPFDIISDRNAMSAAHKSLELRPDGIHGCSTFAALHARADLGMAAPCFVDTAAFLGVIKSLPRDSDIKLQLKENAVHWKAARANGRISCINVENMPHVQWRAQLKTQAFRPDGNFKRALLLAATSCDHPALDTAGIYVVVIDNRGGLSMYSSDNLTISLCELGRAAAAMPERVILPPAAAKLLHEMVEPDTGRMEFANGSVYYEDTVYRCIIRQKAPPQYDISRSYQNWLAADHVVSLQRDCIAAFIRRVNALGQNRSEAVVRLGAERGRITLHFNEATASSTEYFLVENADIPAVAPLPILAAALARVLSSVDEIVLDHAERNVLVFRGSDPDFRYFLSIAQE